MPGCDVFKVDILKNIAAIWHIEIIFDWLTNKEIRVEFLVVYSI